MKNSPENVPPKSEAARPDRHLTKENLRQKELGEKKSGKAGDVEPRASTSPVCYAESLELRPEYRLP